MSEARCAVCERPLAPGDWVYETRREDKWVHGACLDVWSAHYWPGGARARREAIGSVAYGVKRDHFSRVP
jgi:hypothetical protein